MSTNVVCFDIEVYCGKTMVPCEQPAVLVICSGLSLLACIILTSFRVYSVGRKKKIKSSDQLGY